MRLRTTISLSLCILGLQTMPAFAMTMPTSAAHMSNRLVRQNAIEQRQRTQQPYSYTAAEEQLYSSEDLGFSMRFPRGWIAKDIWQKQGVITTVALFLSPLDDANDVQRENVSLVTEDLSSPLPLDAYADAAIAREQEIFSGFQLLNSESLLLPDGIPAHTITFTATPVELPLTFEQVWMERQGKIIVWTLAASAETYHQYAPIFHGMLQSLTFN